MKRPSFYGEYCHLCKERLSVVKCLGRRVCLGCYGTLTRFKKTQDKLTREAMRK